MLLQNRRDDEVKPFFLGPGGMLLQNRRDGGGKHLGASKHVYVCAIIASTKITRRRKKLFLGKGGRV